MVKVVPSITAKQTVTISCLEDGPIFISIHLSCLLLFNFNRRSICHLGVSLTRVSELFHKRRQHYMYLAKLHISFWIKTITKYSVPFDLLCILDSDHPHRMRNTESWLNFDCVSNITLGFDVSFDSIHSQFYSFFPFGNYLWHLKSVM